ncbi:cation:proton antiporter [Kiloniella sp. b19]|uniref:cation:proton antiporter n=1 Tax=Kiloniella sp. GXU_MW_B19 TaxID=3141326 RepID=UPI0031D20F95
MTDHGSALTLLAITVLGALACGIFMRQARQPAVLGYIIAGMLLGPAGFAFVEDRESTALLAEMGVLLLLFVIGMELSLRGIKEVWKVALVTTAMQIVVGLGAMFAFGQLFDWSTETNIVLGFVVALSSTAVTVKMLEDINELSTRVGQITIGILIAQDLAVVPMMLIVSSMGGEDGIPQGAMVKVGLSVVLLVVLLAWLSKKRGLRLPLARAIGDNHDLTPLSGLAFCFGAAALSGLLGLSAAYGAFLAGLVIGNSSSRKVMLKHVQPIQSILLMVFFLSIGLLLDLGYIWDNLGTVLLIVFFVAVFKTALNIGLIRLLGENWPRSILSGVLLAQLGEFSFVLAALGVGSAVISDEIHRLIVAVTVISLVISPFWIATARRLHLIAQLGITSGRETMRLTFGAEFQSFWSTLLQIENRIFSILRKAGERLPPLPARLNRHKNNETQKTGQRDDSPENETTDTGKP